MSPFDCQKCQCCMSHVTILKAMSHVDRLQYSTYCMSNLRNSHFALSNLGVKGHIILITNIILLQGGISGILIH